jgi:hypothetical protein
VEALSRFYSATRFTLSKSEILYQAGHSAGSSLDAGQRAYEAQTLMLRTAASEQRETQQILDSSRRTSGAPRRDPDAPTRVRVLAPFAIDGGIAQVDSIVTCPARSAVAGGDRSSRLCLSSGPW